MTRMSHTSWSDSNSEENHPKYWKNISWSSYQMIKKKEYFLYSTENKCDHIS